ncbi:MAG: flagellar basal body L-ring protein FlgH [Hyphomicrobiaceae bacterium]|nr:flagellar basal body L-ring protein FlgH [Hyphomicrobiaceae bacterium]
MTRSILSLALILGLGFALGGCSIADRLDKLGKQPSLSAIEDPTASAGYRPVSLPMPAPQPAVYAPNSLWKSGARTFFKDQRAHQIGDILTVKVSISDKAQIDNETKRNRTGSDNVGVGGVAAYPLKKILPASIATDELVSTDSAMSATGKGSVNRSEDLVTNVAGVVTQVLPNGNLVIEGRQEVRVNFEVRELIVAGIIRPEDIGSDNTIESNKIAEARIAYGGRGQITDVQQPRYGQQFLDVILPF